MTTLTNYIAPIAPTAFGGRPSMPIRKLAPLEVARHKKFMGKLLFAILIPFGTLGGFIFFFPLGVLNAFGWLISWLLMPGRIAEMFSGKWQQGECPNCMRLLNFTSDAFNCPFCRHRIMKYGTSIVDIV